MPILCCFGENYTNSPQSVAMAHLFCYDIACQTVCNKKLMKRGIKMDEKNLNPQEETNTPASEETKAETTADTENKAEKNNTSNMENATKKGGIFALCKEKKGLVIAITVIAVALAVILSVVLLKSCGTPTDPATADEVTTTPETEAATTVPETQPDGTEDTTWPDGTPYEETQDWKALKEVNTDIKGWITMKNTPINYPVLVSEEDGFGYQYYLHRGYDKSYDYAGSIFIDYRSKEGEKSRNILTHGHSMNDGSMYKALIDFGEYEADMNFYKKNPTLFFNTPEGNEQWIIFAVVKTNTLEDHGDFFNYLMGSFESDAQYMNYIYNMKVRSIIDIPVPINETDDIITLSTCSYEYTDFRTVVCARKIRNNEKVNDYINAAKPAENPLWPDVHYSYDDKQPEITTFKTELQKNNLPWYDGKGDLEGNEWLVMTTGSKRFTVTFINYDGSIISTQQVSQGKSASAPPDPVKPDSENYTYRFVEWGLDFSDVDCNMTIAPKFEAIPK